MNHAPATWTGYSYRRRRLNGTGSWDTQMLRFLLARMKYHDPRIAISAANIVAFPGLARLPLMQPSSSIRFFNPTNGKSRVDQSRHLPTRVEKALSVSRNGNIDDKELLRRTALESSSQYTNSHSLRLSFVLAE